MKVTALLQRRRRHRPGPAISLFPFLAVLICTMGALVPLLLAIARQARLQALQEAATKVAQQQDEVQTERGMVKWRIGQLKTSRQKTGEQLTEARLVLGHIEDHARRLRGQVTGLQASWDDLEKLGSQGSRQRAEVETDLQQVQTEITRAEQQLGDARRAAAQREPSYAVVPYEGPNQTRRRPIYIECTAEAVILQPEGLMLAADDFEGPLGPGNPLAAALRATREYLLTHGGFDPQQSGEPYPLLLVRPEGVAAYWAARAAMKSWGPEFGYELIDEGWKLDFPKPDAELAQVLRQAVQSARVHQQRLIAAAPRHYGQSPRAIYRAAPGGGGVILEGGSSDRDDSGYFPGGPTGGYGRRYGGTGGTGGIGTGDRYGSAGGGTGTGDRYGSAGDGTGTGDRYGSAGDGTGTGDRYGSAGGGVGTGDRYGSTGGGTGTGDRYGSTGGGVGTGDRYGSAGGGIGPGDPYGSSGDGTPGGQYGSSVTGGTAEPRGSNGGTAGGQANRGTRREGTLSGGPPRETSPSTSGGTEGGVALRPGEWYPTERPPPEKPEKPDDDKKHGGGKKPAKNLAEARGKDWGLRDAASGSAPITRSIRVECDRDRLVLIPERGLSGGKVLPLRARTADSIDDFIAAVWAYMESWGIAGKGMYWRPILHVYVAPDAEQRYQDLSTLLEGSGLTVERRSGQWSVVSGQWSVTTGS